jgi:hypothetical protein
MKKSAMEYRIQKKSRKGNENEANDDSTAKMLEWSEIGSTELNQKAAAGESTENWKKECES